MRHWLICAVLFCCGIAVAVGAAEDPKAAGACMTCHKEKSPGLYQQWYDSEHAAHNVTCLGCHQAQRGDEPTPSALRRPHRDAGHACRLRPLPRPGGRRGRQLLPRHGRPDPGLGGRLPGPRGRRRSGGDRWAARAATAPRSRSTPRAPTSWPARAGRTRGSAASTPTVRSVRATHVTPATAFPRPRPGSPRRARSATSVRTTRRRRSTRSRSTATPTSPTTRR